MLVRLRIYVKKSNAPDAAAAEHLARILATIERFKRLRGFLFASEGAVRPTPHLLPQTIKFFIYDPEA